MLDGILERAEPRVPGQQVLHGERCAAQHELLEQQLLPRRHPSGQARDERIETRERDGVATPRRRARGGKDPWNQPPAQAVAIPRAPAGVGHGR